MELDTNFWNEIVQAVNNPFLATIWFYLAVAAVTMFMKWFKDQDHKVHKRWYLPIALGSSYVLAVLLVIMVTSITWAMVIENGLFIFIGQLIIGDQVVKRFEKVPEGE